MCGSVHIHTENTNWPQTRVETPSKSSNRGHFQNNAMKEASGSSPAEVTFPQAQSPDAAVARGEAPQNNLSN